MRRTISSNFHYYIYSLLVFAGLMLCLFTVATSISKIESYEHNTNRIHRLVTASEIELATLEKEAVVIEKTLDDLKQQIEKNSPDKKKLGVQFVNLSRDIKRLHTDIAEKQKLVITLNLLKTSTLSQIKTLFWVNSLVLVAGFILIVAGAAALAFRLEIFPDRRKRRRKAEEMQEETTSEA